MSDTPSNTSMPTATLIDPAILDTVLGRLALLFLTGAGDDITVARQAALHMLVAYKVETAEELGLAAEVISFGCHALQALSQAMEPDLPLNKIIRLRGSAVSLSREAHRNQRKLDQLQRDRLAAADAPPLQATTQQPAATPDASPNNANTPAPQAAQPQAVQARTWTQAYHDRQRDKRLAEAARKKQAHLTPAPNHPDAALACSVMAAEAAIPAAQAG